MKLRELVACVVLVHGSMGSHALAQGFNSRYDPLEQDGQENGWSIERNGNGYMVVGTTTCLLIGNIYYDPLVFSLSISAEGEVATLDTFLYVAHAIYPGAWNCMNRDADGGFISGGSTYSQNGTQRFALWRYGPDGVIELLGEYGPEGDERIGRTAIAGKNGNYLIVGASDSIGDIDAMLIRVDHDGEIIWTKTYGGPYFDFGWSIDTTSATGYFVGGQAKTTADNTDLWVFRIDEEGNTLWSNSWGTEFNDMRAFLSAKSNGNPIVASGLFHSATGYPFCYLAELDADNGEIIWEREYAPQIEGTVFSSVKEVAPGNGHIAAGVETEDGSNFLKGLLLRTADNGDSLWMRTYFYYDSTTTDVVGDFKDVVPTLDGGFIACGTSYNPYNQAYPPGTSQDVWIVKVDSLGCIIPGCDDFSTVITVQATNLKGALRVYPNPAYGNTTVNVTLPRSTPFLGELRLRMVSAHGQEVIDQQAVQGENQLSLRDLAGGVYYVHLTIGSTWLSGTKLIVE